MFYSVYSLIFAIYSLSCVSRAYKAVCFAKHIFFYISLKRKKNCFVVPFWTNYEEIRSPLRSLLLSLVSLLLFIRMVKQKKTTKERPSWWPVFQGWNNGAMNIIYVYWFRCWVRDGVVWALLLYDGCMCILQYIFSFLFHYYTAFVSICFSSLLQLISIRIFCSISLFYVACIRIEFGTMECHDYCVLIENYCLYTQTKIQIENCFSE